MELSDRHLLILYYLKQHPKTSAAKIQKAIELSLTRRYINELHGAGLLTWHRPNPTTREKEWSLTQMAEDFLSAKVLDTTQPKK